MGTRYKAGGVVVLSVEDYNFGPICDVIVFDVDDYELNTECFNSHFHAHEVSHDRKPSFAFVKQPDLADHSVLGLYKKADTCFVVSTLSYKCL